MTKTKWPAVVPVFTPRMIYKWGDDSDKLGYQTTCADLALGMNFKYEYQSERARNVLRTIIGLSTVEYVFGDAQDIVAWNDRRTTTKREIADALNETMRRLGYVIIFDVEE